MTASRPFKSTGSFSFLPVWHPSSRPLVPAGRRPRRSTFRPSATTSIESPHPARRAILRPCPLARIPKALAFDTFGNLFVAGGGDVSKITPGGTVSHFADLPVGAGGYGMVIDAGNNLYVAGVSVGRDQQDHSRRHGEPLCDHLYPPRVWPLTASATSTRRVAIPFYKIAPGGSTPSIYATFTGHTNTYGLAFDSAGYLYVSDITTTTLFKIRPRRRLVHQLWNAQLRSQRSGL